MGVGRDETQAGLTRRFLRTKATTATTYIVQFDQDLVGWVSSLQIKGQNIPHQGQDAARSNPNAKPVSEPGWQEDRFGRLPERSSSSQYGILHSLQGEREAHS